MILLSVSIAVTLIIVIGLPIAASVWVNKKFGVSWRTITYGILGYFIVQILVSLLYSGLLSLIPEWNTAGVDQNYLLSQILVNIFLGALLGVVTRWLGMKYFKLDSLESAYALGVGYGGAESIMLVGLPLLTTFATMLGNINIDPQTTSLDPAAVEQLQELWALEFYVPLATMVERITAFVMHITVTVIILQVFKRKNLVWLGGAFLLEFLINGLIVGLAEAGVHYGWVVLLGVVFMAGNIYLLYRLNALDPFISRIKKQSPDERGLSEKD
jgi:uncharacterized membrane protein YhfC